MKKNLLAIFLLLTFLISAQNRVNDKLPIITKSNSALITATGWLKNQSGQWISGKNKIPQDLGEDQKILGNYEGYGLGNDNFASLEIKDLIIADSTYAILIKKYRDGYYTYSSIKKGWNNIAGYKYFVFSKSELAKLKDVKSDSLSVITFKILSKGYVSSVNPATFIDNIIAKDIVKEMQGNKYPEYDDILNPVLGFNIHYFKVKNIVQFIFYDEPLFFLDGNFNKDDKETRVYYETDATTFKKFLNFGQPIIS